MTYQTGEKLPERLATDASGLDASTVDDTIRVMPVIENTPGARLRAARKAAGLSAASIAKRVGGATSAVTNHENGINGIRAETAATYAEILGVTPQWILYGDEQGAKPPSPASDPSHGAKLRTLPNGKARLDLSITLPFSTALQILALVEGVEK